MYPPCTLRSTTALDKQWIRDTSLLIFISYSNQDKKLAGELKEELEVYGFQVFLAHETINVSTKWEREIIRNLRICDALVALLTKNFRVSTWTDQEVGAALILNKTIVPLLAGEKCHGFLQSFQGKKLSARNPRTTCWQIVKELSKDKRVGPKLKDAFIPKCLRSGTFDEATENFSRLVELLPLSPTQAVDVVKGASVNRNIYGSFRARPFLDKIISANSTLPRKLVNKYRKAVHDWDYP